MPLLELYNRIKFALRIRNKKLPPPPKPKILDAAEVADKSLSQLNNAKYIIEDLLESSILTKADTQQLESFYTKAEFNLSNFRNEILRLYQEKDPKDVQETKE